MKKITDRPARNLARQQKNPRFSEFDKDVQSSGISQRFINIPVNVAFSMIIIDMELQTLLVGGFEYFLIFRILGF